jgi:YcxB-like protein
MENGDPIVVLVQVTSKDLLELIRASRMWYLIWLLLAIGAFYVYLACAEVMGHGVSAESFFTVVLYSFVAALALFGAYVAPRLRVRMELRSAPTLQAPRTYSLAGSGISFSSDIAFGTYRWDAFYRIIESHTSFLFFLSTLSAVIVPKRCFPSLDEVARTRELIRAQFTGKKDLSH